jgi:hypothetical protein
MARDKAKKTGSEKGGGRHAKLVEELTRKLSDIDQDGLEFLNKQADVLIYNAKVDELNKKIRQTVRPAAFSGPKISANEVSIERTKDDFFQIHAGGQKVFFNLEEMRALTRIAHGAEDADTGARRLHRWFLRERKDFLTDIGIDSPSSQYLKRLYEIIIQTYKVKKS